MVRIIFNIEGSAILYCLCYIILAIHYRSSFASTTARMTVSFLLSCSGAMRKSSSVRSPSKERHTDCWNNISPSQYHRNAIISNEWNPACTILVIIKLRKQNNISAKQKVQWEKIPIKITVLAQYILVAFSFSCLFHILYNIKYCIQCIK